jgi:hypothetical protein
MDHPAPLPKDAVVRVVNRAKNERKKKEKDDRKKKTQKKARTWLDRGKRRQGSEEEKDEMDDEEEEEGAYGSASPIPWEYLADEEPAGGDASLVGPFPFTRGRVCPRSRQWRVTMHHPSPSNRGKARSDHTPTRCSQGQVGRP